MVIRTLFAICLLLPQAATASETRVAFDLPSTIECRDVTPAEFAASHPALKVIEARFRISARLMEGAQNDIVDFVYTITSDNKTMRLQDYLPNTTLESAVADDQIEITNASELGKSTTGDAHVVYKVFAVGGSHNQNSKKSESSHYKQIAAKDLVLSAGTTHREHGVFFRLRPSRAGSLEGAKEFTFLATVPKTWRGDLCTISCTARGKKTSLISTTVVPCGSESTQIGLFLSGDNEAASIAEKLCRAQEAYAMALSAQGAKAGTFDTFATQATGLFTGKKSDPQADAVHKQLVDGHQALLDIQDRLKELAR